MPLPTNGTLSLQGYSRPGDTVHSTKQAMIVRMSAETLEALQFFPQHPQMDFEFGEKPVRSFLYPSWLLSSNYFAGNIHW
jgi:RNA polymerase II elongation factor ELL